MIFLRCTITKTEVYLYNFYKSLTCLIFIDTLHFPDLQFHTSGFRISVQNFGSSFIWRSSGYILYRELPWYAGNPDYWQNEETEVTARFSSLPLVVNDLGPSISKQYICEVRMVSKEKLE